MSISIIRQIYMIHCYIASIISIAVNSLLLYLIIKHTNKELKAYSHILLMTCIIDMFQTIMVFLFKPQVEFIDGTLYFIIDCFFPIENILLIFVLVLIGAFAIFICIFTLPVPIYFRYSMLCKQKVSNNSPLIILIFISAISTIIYVALLGAALFPTESSINENIGALNNSIWLEDGKLPIFIASSASNLYLKIDLIYVFFISGLCYLLIAYYNYQVWTWLKLNKKFMSKKNLVLQKQLTYALIIQAISPLLTGILPVLVIVIFLLLHMKVYGISMLLTGAMLWFTAINAIATIGFIGPYRRALCRKLRFYKKNSVLQPPKQLNLNNNKIFVINK